MALSNSRCIAVGETPYAHEQEGVTFARQALPDRDPFHLWALLNLLDPSSGRLHEIDLIVIGYSSIYLVELKHYAGEMAGDQHDWTWTTPEGKPLYRENPYGLTRRKSQILKSLLERTKAMRTASVRVPWIQPLVFLSNADIKVNLQPEGRVGVVTQSTFAEAITHGKFPGNGHQTQSQRIDSKQLRAVVKAFDEIGIRPRKGKLHVGSYELKGVTNETDSYQDRDAVHRTNPKLQKRARIYLVPKQTSVERQQHLRRAASRETQLLYEVREHSGVLTFSDYIADAPLGPTVLFDAFEGGVPLDAFMRRHPDLGYSDRIEIIEQIGRALDHCHKKEIVHGSVSPASILVRKEEHGIAAKLFNFQLGGSDAVEATSHWSVLAGEQWDLYQAPELRANPNQRTPQSDLFSLGAVAYFCLTNRAPAGNLLELFQILREHRCLDPRIVDDNVSEDVAEIVCQATHEVLLQRCDDVGEWVDLLLEYATAPASVVATPEVNPLSANKDDILLTPAGELIVLGVLGHGATSRVLKVERGDEKQFALKVSISPAHDDRLLAEAKVLAKLRHPRIVQFESHFSLDGRVCLLLSIAGSRTLYTTLHNEGTVSLDYAARYGEDLLSALEHLEENDIIHRDIKPANVGVGARPGKKLHLTLFDFSLGDISRSEVTVGTAAYRDPHLPRRGEWDAAGDRWSAAMTLHEMLCAKRPTILQTERDSTNHGIAVQLAAERFDPSVRQTLQAFFTRAFAPETEARFTDAQSMRKAWEQAFLQQEDHAADVAETLSAQIKAQSSEMLSDEEIASIEASTAIAALPLSHRVKSALDRAGVLTVMDLQGLADNRLSAIRGVGREVAKDILNFRRRWTALAGIEATSGPVFFPNYRGDALMLAASTKLSLATQQRLRDAGLSTLQQLAEAPLQHLQALANQRDSGHVLDLPGIRQVLAAENDKADALNAPTTLQGWIDALVPAKSRRKSDQHVRALFGLEGPLQGTIGNSANQLARELNITAPVIYIALNKCKEAWRKHPTVDELLQIVQQQVDGAGGAIALRRCAQQLLQGLPHDSAADGAQQLLQASALVRVCLENDKDRGGQLHYVRFASASDGSGDIDEPWIFSSDDRVSIVRKLGKVADEFATRDILAGPSEVARALESVVQDTVLAGLARDKLARLAANASKSAACSSRLELYPRQMPAARALELSSAILGNRVTPDALRARVQARYPAARALPPRPALDALLNDLHFEEASGTYVRSDPSGPSRHTQNQGPTSLTQVAAARTGIAIDATQVAAGAFEDKMRSCLEYRSLLVLGVSIDKSDDAARALTQCFGLQAQSFDQLFVDTLKHTMSDKNISAPVVYQADQEGPSGDAWGNLSKLASAVATSIATDILPPKRPLLLTHPGLIDRYQLHDFIQAMVNASHDDAAAATILLVPGYESGTVKIEGRTEIPGLLPGQCIKISNSWLHTHR